MKIEKKNINKNKQILKIIENKKTPLSGNNRSFSCIATKRTWAHNKQKVKINGKSYQLSPKIFKKLSKKIG